MHAARDHRCSEHRDRAALDDGLHRRTQGCDARARPLDLVLDDAALERVTSDAQQVRGFDDAACSNEGFLTKFALGVSEVEGFENDRHEATIVGSRCPVKIKTSSTTQFVHVLKIKWVPKNVMYLGTS